MHFHPSISDRMIRKKILYVEDEVNLGTIVSETLESKGFEVLLIRDGALVMQSFKKFMPDICVLDVMLPHTDGFELGREIRKLYKQLPIIFLTAKTQTQDVVSGFNSGGTDYMRKPFSVEELLVRIHNQLRIKAGNEPSNIDSISLGQFIFYPQKFELIFPGTTIKLSNREAEVLTVFAQHINRTIDRKMLLLAVWGDDSFFHSRNLDVYIRKLREYFAPDPNVQIITLKGKGYQFMVENQ